jgi:hypothetical protein
VAVNSPNFDPQKYLDKVHDENCALSKKLVETQLDFDASAKNQSDNKAIYRKKYGCEV